MSPAQRAAAVLAAAAIAVPTIAHFEGYVPVGYPDPALGVNLPTACYGSTKGVVIGRRYSPDECAQRLAVDAAEHGLQIDRCLPEDLPIKTRAAFTSFGFNIGTAKFCASTLSAKARAGDLRGACNELSRWTLAAGRRLPGLVKRRAAERALCLEGLP